MPRKRSDGRTLTGGDSDQRRKNALIGLGVGALAGGAVGHYMDRQEEKLRVQLSQTGVSVTRVGDNIILNMPGNVTFQVNRADLNPSFHRVLASVAVVTTHFEMTIFEV